MAVRPVLLLVALALLVAGCGGDDETAPTNTTTTTASGETVNVRVYFLREGKVWPVLREVPKDDEQATWAFSELTRGPTQEGEADLGLSTQIPTFDGQADSLEVRNGVARFTSTVTFTDAAYAQIVHTLSQFPAVRKVVIEGKSRTRADFEDFTPAILVESPLPFEDVEIPLRVTGTANTFEATFSYELTDTDGLIVDEDFVTATSGTGTRGTFDFTTKPFTVPFDGVGSLIVFELSAKDGSRINLVEIPLRMRR